MIFDSNTAIGHWPFRRIPHETAEALRAHLQGKGIARAAAVHTHGLFYNNVHDANLELAEAIAAHRDFFTGVATLNPMYPAWERDLHACVESLGMKALRLVPRYHNYELNAPQARDIVMAATALNLPILMPCVLVDVRGRHWMDTERGGLGIEEIGQLAMSVPKARILMTGGGPSPEQLLNADKTVKYPGLYCEISSMRSAYGQMIAALAKAIGADHLLFGSGAPFREVTPALLKLENSDCPKDEREQIAYRNACSFFS
jgi:predicted TIM-barrel fold metal-dependent hydrolase